MENLSSPGRLALSAWAILLTACAQAPVAADKSDPPALPAARVNIAQVGTGTAVRYVFCEVERCPLPTSKTAAIRTPAALPNSPAKAPSTATVDVAFPFNSSRVSDGDRHALSQAASTHPDARVEITARSDYVGPPAGQQQVVAARARAMRSIVAKESHGTLFTERHEVADPKPVAAAEQAKQRRGTVLFIPPIDVQLKGTPK